MLESDSFNHELLVGEMVVGAVIPNSSCRYAFQTQNKYFKIILLSSTEMSCPRELNSDVMPHPNKLAR